MTTAIKNVKESLHLARAEARFDIGCERRQDTSRAVRLLTPHQIRQTFENAKWGDDDLQRSLRAQAIVPTAIFEKLAERLRLSLGAYLDPESDRIGHAFPLAGGHGGRTTATSNGLFTETSSSSVTSLAKVLIKGAAVLGVDRVSDLLDGWIQGEPVRYYTSTVVGLTLKRALSPLEGILFCPLPLSTEDLASWLPSSARNVRGASYLGHTVVSVASEVQPALLHPSSIAADGSVEAKLSAGFSLETIWDALALVCDNYVQTGLRWNDYRDWFVLTRGIGFTAGGLSRMGHPTGSTLSTTVHAGKNRGRISDLSFPEGAIQDISKDMLQQTLSALRASDAQTNIAVRRWRRSIQPIADLTDRFIDLRIALESLFLANQPTHEMKFRLAVNAAWLLGDDINDRRRVLDTVRKSYDTSSKAVHAGNVDPHPENQTLIAEAQDLCRKGILAVLGKGGVSDWTSLILGSHIEK